MLGRVPLEVVRHEPTDGIDGQTPASQLLYRSPHQHITQAMTPTVRRDHRVWHHRHVAPHLVVGESDHRGGAALDGLDELESATLWNVANIHRTIVVRREPVVGSAAQRRHPAHREATMGAAARSCWHNRDPQAGSDTPGDQTPTDQTHLSNTPNDEAHMSDPNARDWETLDYAETDDGVAVVTLDRPEVHNAFNRTMQRELHDMWRALRLHDPVRCVVLTGAGDKAFCTGIDRAEQMGGDADSLDDDHHRIGDAGTPFQFDDPGDLIGPKTADLWKPVVGAVNGMACGGAFYLLGEVEFIIAAEHATFFDPHVTYGMCATFEPLHMLTKMPFGEVMRMSLMGNHERLSAQRAHQIGLVTEVVGGEELATTAQGVAAAIASAPTVAVQGTVRSIWAGLEMTRSQALAQGYAFIGLGTNEESLAEGQAAFSSGRRIEWKLR